MFLGLRKKSGVSMARFEEKFSQSFEEIYGKIVRDLVQQGLMQIDGDRVRMRKRVSFGRYCSRTIYFGVGLWA